MACFLVVWGLDIRDSSREKDVMIRHGYTGDIECYDHGNTAWCTVCFSSLTAAEACMTELQECFSSLQMCIEPDWQTFGKDEAIAAADLIRLAEWLGCRDKPCALPCHKAVCLARGATAILAAVDKAGGVQALAAADPAAATCLGHCLAEVACNTRFRPPSDVSSQLMHSFGQLGPQMLPAAAAEVREGVCGSPQRACAAVCLAQALLTAGSHDTQPNDVLSSRHQQEQITSGCVGLLHAVVHALSACLAAIGPAAQQHRLLGKARQRAALQRTVIQQEEQRASLQMAACNLLRCLREPVLRSGIGEHLLLDTLGKLTQQCVASVLVEGHAAAAGLQLEAALPIPGCLRELHLTLHNTLSTMDNAAKAAAGVAALYSTVLKTLRKALDSIPTPQHIGVLLGLLLLLQDTLPDDGELRKGEALMVELPRVLQLAAAWLATERQELLQQSGAQHQPFGCGILSFADQLSLLADITVSFFAEAVVGLLDACNVDGRTYEVDLKVISALAAVLKVDSASNCRNVRDQFPGLAYPDCPECHFAPGLASAGGSLLHIAVAPCCKLDVALADARRQKWANALVASLLHGGVGTFWLAHAEAAAQAALPEASPKAKQKGQHLLGCLRFQWVELLRIVRQSRTVQLARTLVSSGAVPVLMQVLALPMQMPSTSAETAANALAWQDTVHGVSSICDILAGILVGDPAAARAAVLRDGSWEVAVQRVRGLQPPSWSVEGWPEQREARLRVVTALLEGGGGGAAAADAAAVAAAERAMQELLAAEQATESSGPPGKAGSKRARRKAAREQAAAAAHGESTASSATGPTAAAASTAGSQSVVTSCSSSSTPGGESHQPAAAAAVPQSATPMASDSPGTESPQAQLPAATGLSAKAADWWRCPLSGEVMRDPVLYGGGGHSFEREALEQWLAANPGVDPLSREPLPPEADAILPNHALRNMIQQLQLA